MQLKALSNIAILSLTALAASGSHLRSSKNTQKRAESSAVDTIAFENVGFTGYYYDVEDILDATSDDCSCTLSDSFTVFEGSNAPLDEELSIHFRGPLSLKLFGAYTADDSSTGTWERISYYDADSQTSSNVTFLTHAGESSTCLGSALSYASSNGTGYADSSTILEANNLINSNEEFIIFSGLECPDSDIDNSCGIYRSGTPAYHGFSGTTKMFLFEFEMPEANVTLEYYYNMPAIWFLNAKIPRTSQYGSDSSCSCWNSGCGEIDIFEVMNSSTTDQLYATIHDYQGTGDINSGMQANGYFSRDSSSTMKGGVVFGTDGTISIFMLDNLDISESLEASSVTSWVSDTNEVVDTLSSVTMNTEVTSSTASESSNGGICLNQSRTAAFMILVFLILLSI